MRVSPGRGEVRPTAQKPDQYKPVSIPGPVRGWIASGSIAAPQPGGAEVLENFFPTATGAILRRGSERYATLGDGTLPVTTIFSYKNGAQEELFAGTQSAIYDITTISSAFNYILSDEDDNWLVTDTGDTFGENSTEGKEVISGQTSGDWVVVQFATSGGVFLRGVNGSDTPILYDGSTWGTTPAITGAVPEDLNYVWVYKSRLFFVEKNSLNAWYLPVDSIGGAATKFPLGGVFTLGGRLLFGASWSLGEGASGGLSAQCVFVSSEGEVAVYQGSDPGSPSDWSLVGVYRIGKPLGKQAHIRAGGDIVIATDIGFVPLSQALQRDYAALSPSAVSAPIEVEWNKEVARRTGTPWQCEVWPDKQMVAVALPTTSGTEPSVFVANTRTGAWGHFTGWDMTCMEVFKGRLFFGSQDGRVVEAMVTGQDEGNPFTGVYVPMFTDLGAAGYKVTGMCRAVLKARYPLREKVSVQEDYNVNLPSAPDAAPISDASVWGTAIWGSSTWGAPYDAEVYQRWRTVTGAGHALSPAVQVTSGALTPLDVEIIRTDLTFKVGSFTV